MARASFSTNAAAGFGGNGVPELLIQTAAGAVLQREERHAVVFADIIDLDDVRMLQPGDGLASVWKRPARRPPAWSPPGSS